MQRSIARQIRRLCRVAKIKRKICVGKDFVKVNEDVVFFNPTHSFISRLATVLLEIPATKEMLDMQHTILQQLRSIDTSEWNSGRPA